MNDDSSAIPFQSAVLPRSHLTWAPPAGTVHLTARADDLSRRQENWHGWFPAATLAPLAARPDAAITLNSRRGYLSDSPENHLLERLLHDRPEDFGAEGTPIVLGADHIAAHRHTAGDRITLQVHGLECIDGFQRLVTIGHSRRGPESGHLDRAFARVDLLTGTARERARRLHYESQLYANVARPQDNLSRCPHLARCGEQFEVEGTSFDCRRGIVAGPHSYGYDITTVFRALACLSLDPYPDLAHVLSTDEGLDSVWNDLEGPRYRAIVNPDVQAWSIQRAVETHDVVQQVLRGLTNSATTGHGHLIRYARPLIVWSAARRLPLHELHNGGRDAPDWHARIRSSAFRADVKATAHALVAAYRSVRPKENGQYKQYKGEVERLDVWREIVDRMRCAHE